MRDDIDYIPTNRFVLWGHHFTAVAGAAPIIGPGIAVIWGWLPAFLWVVFGTMFFAGVHDFGAVWASVRNKAKSVGSLTGDVVSPRARTLFMIVVFFLLMMVNAVFGVAIADAFQETPAVWSRPGAPSSWRWRSVCSSTGCTCRSCGQPSSAR